MIFGEVNGDWDWDWDGRGSGSESFQGEYLSHSLGGLCERKREGFVNQAVTDRGGDDIHNPRTQSPGTRDTQRDLLATDLTQRKQAPACSSERRERNTRGSMSVRGLGGGETY